MRVITIALITHLIVNVFSETPVGNATAKYDPAELLRKIFNTNDTILPRANYGLVQFEGQNSLPEFINLQTQSDQENNRENIFNHDNSVKFENDYNLSYDTNHQNVVKFVDENKEASRKKKRRKRKPKQHYGIQSPGNVPNLPYPGYGYAPSLPHPGYYGNQQSLPLSGNGPVYPPYGGQNYRPPRRRPRPSAASAALSAVTAALTSIALYDDYQCVPRLLCEAAAGGALGSAGVLQTVSGLQPLLTLLSAYGGLTSNPLFVFGRAALLGASDGNAATCRYAYPHCPTDPERLVHYLNNHNGGFFRFFNAPQQGQQNVEQFYNQLSHNFGPYEYDPNQEYSQNINQQNYGLYNNQQNYGHQNPGLYSNDNQYYGPAYPYQNQNIRFKNNDDFKENANEIQKRIQNNPNAHFFDDLDEGNSRWTFPEGNRNVQVNYVNNDAFNSFSANNNVRDSDEEFNYYDRNRYHNDKRKGKILKFPGSINNEENSQAFEDNRGSFFPDQDNKQYLDYTGPFNNNYDKRQYLDYNNPSNNYYDSKYQDDSQYFNQNTATSHNNYDDKYNDKRHYSEFNYPSNNNYYDSKYHDKRQYHDYNSDINHNNYNDKYNNDNRYYQDYNTNSNKNYENKYADSDANYYTNRYYGNKYTDNYVNKNKYNYNNDLQEGVRTVYVVRGNGDPNNPEVHKLRPGESIP